MVTFELKMPVSFEGQEVKKLEMDVEALAYKDLRRAERMAETLCGKKESLNVIKVFDDRYLACVAAVAAKVKPELMFELKAPDFIQLMTLMRNFLLNGDWATDEEPTDAE